ncbi:hypothetical protein I4F81_001990 [Pyropia yezoensis]|uniref:Uncharacterized protein n=1 Tax=Pyropia yezoensis TaxID=2788 RepID=A0ACC3BN87_PYRYE|nr:hypothetical protein I4F81_001990 [Neopyropia yezoensis]
MSGVLSGGAAPPPPSPGAAAEEPPADAIGDALAALTHRGAHARRTRLAALSLLSALCASADDADAVARRGGVTSAASTLRIASHRRGGRGWQGEGGGAEAAAAARTVADCVANTVPAAAEAATAGGAVPALLRLLVPPQELARRRALALDGIAASVLAVDQATGGGAREVRRALVLMEALVRDVREAAAAALLAIDGV